METIDLIVRHCKELVTVTNPSRRPKVKGEMDELDIIRDGALAVSGDRLVFVGKTSNLAEKIRWNDSTTTTIDASDDVVMPGFVDPHTHAVFGGSRVEEFVQKLSGTTYLEILEKGGGILKTVRETRRLSAEELASVSRSYLETMLLHGTTTVEIKTGYGLDRENELKMLRAIHSLQQLLPLEIVPTFLGAHAVPPEHKGRSDDYINTVLDMLPEAAEYAEFCDIFCEEGAFSFDQSRRILTKAKELGFRLKIHAGQFHDLGAAELAADLEATTADHLEQVSEDAMDRMAEKGVIGVLLPAVTFFLGGNRYAPAREMLNKGVPLALATDFNPGSSPTENMQIIIALACIKMKLTPEQAINGATINAAHALDRGHEVGSLEVGKKADFVLLRLPSYDHLPYRFGINHVHSVVKRGKIVVDRRRFA
jgi:imidazolonepropionase